MSRLPLWESEGLELLHHVFTVGRRIHALVDGPDEAALIDVEGPALRVSASRADDPIGLGRFPGGVTQDREGSADRFSESPVGLGVIQAHHGVGDVEFGQCFLAVTQRGEFRRSARCESLGEPSQHQALGIGQYALKGVGLAVAPRK